MNFRRTNRPRRLITGAFVVAATLVLAALPLFHIACQEPTPTQLADGVSVPKKLVVPSLPNPLQLHPKVISGGLPEGDEGFAALKKLGIRTIISVDGAKPDVETATKFGMRYVHLPHGYDGITDSRVMDLAKAVVDLDGPIYIHCHHGRHRSPAAASAACVTAGLLSPDKSLAILELAGTNPNYKGLYRSVAAARPVDADDLARHEVTFPSTARIPPMAEAMVDLEHTHDRVKLLAGNQWKAIVGRKEIDAAHDTLLLREHFTEILRLDATKRSPAEFVEMLHQSEKDAIELEQLANHLDVQDKVRLDALGKHLERINKNCKTCHEKFRDVPRERK